MAKTTAKTLTPPLLPALSGKGGINHLRETSFLMRVPKGRAVYLTLGDLLSLADNYVDDNI